MGFVLSLVVVMEEIIEHQAERVIFRHRMFWESPLPNLGDRTTRDGYHIQMFVLDQRCKQNTILTVLTGQAVSISEEGMAATRWFSHDGECNDGLEYS